ncbi:hypothetical protein [Tabrizicola sp.]|uniref:hypothetical protein n=1 Tax=Tabrizicola sp. TaxID=2005166 RepID=UPI003F3AD280
MRRKFAFLLFLVAFSSSAGAEVCLEKYKSGDCNLTLSVIPALEEVGVPFEEKSIHVDLTSTEDGQPLAVMTYNVFSTPQSNDRLKKMAELDFGEISDAFARDLFRIHCGQGVRMGIADRRMPFVQAGGAVSYKIKLFLRNPAGDAIHQVEFGQTTIENCGG